MHSRDGHGQAALVALATLTVGNHLPESSCAAAQRAGVEAMHEITALSMACRP